MLPVRVEALLVKHSFFGPAARLCPIFIYRIPLCPVLGEAVGAQGSAAVYLGEVVSKALRESVSVLFDVDSVARHGCVCVLDLSVKGCWSLARLQCTPSVLRWPLRLPSVAHRKMSGPYLSRRWYSPRMLLVDLLARASFSNALQS